MPSKHQAAIKARMRRFGEGYYTARANYLEKMNMPVDPPSQKQARNKAARLARARDDAAIFDEYGEAVLGVARPPGLKVPR